jgi:hypothetical protein
MQVRLAEVVPVWRTGLREALAPARADRCLRVPAQAI